MPSGIKYAVNYLESILTILGKYKVDLCKDLKRHLKSLKLIKPEDHLSKSDKDPEDITKIVKAFEI